MQLLHVLVRAEIVLRHTALCVLLKPVAVAPYGDYIGYSMLGFVQGLCCWTSIALQRFDQWEANERQTSCKRMRSTTVLSESVHVMSSEDTQAC